MQLPHFISASRNFLRRRAPGGVIVALGVLSTSIASAVVVIQPNTEATSKDAKIYEHVSTINFSSDLSLVSADVGAHFLSLVQFDLSSFSPGDVVSSAILTLYSPGLGISGGPASGGTVTVSSILEDWRETNASPGAAPLATYNSFFGPSPTLHIGSVAASQSVTGAGFVDWDITSLVQAWVDGSQANNGVILNISSSMSDIGFADVDSVPGVPGSAPKLTITAVPEPGNYGFVFLGGVALTLGFSRRRIAMV